MNKVSNIHKYMYDFVNDGGSKDYDLNPDVFNHNGVIYNSIYLCRELDLLIMLTTPETIKIMIINVEKRISNNDIYNLFNGPNLSDINHSRIKEFKIESKTLNYIDKLRNLKVNRWLETIDKDISWDNLDVFKYIDTEMSMYDEDGVYCDTNKHQDINMSKLISIFQKSWLGKGRRRIYYSEEYARIIIELFIKNNKGCEYCKVYRYIIKGNIRKIYNNRIFNCASDYKYYNTLSDEDKIILNKEHLRMGIEEIEYHDTMISRQCKK